MSNSKSGSSRGWTNRHRRDGSAPKRRLAQALGIESLENRTLLAVTPTLNVNTGDRAVLVKTGNDTHTVKTGNRDVMVEVGNDTLTIKAGNQTVKLDAGKSSTEAAQSITLKCGGSEIKLAPDGITIKGLTIKIQGETTAEMKALTTTVKGDAMLTLKGGITMIN